MKKIGHIAGSRIWQLGDWAPSLERTLFEQDDFLGDILKDEWAIDVDAACTIAIVAALNGTVVLTTTAVNDDWCTLAHGLNFSAAQACGIEARLSLDTATNCAIEVGFCDALAIADPGSAFEDYDQAATLPTHLTPDAAIIGFDPLDSAANFANFTAVSVINNVPPLAQDMGVLPVGGTFYVLKVQFNAAGDAFFYINGVLLATRLLAVTPADPLTPWINLRNKVGNIRFVTVDYVKFWQNR